MSTVSELADRLLAHAQAQHPDIKEWRLHIAETTSLLLPRHAQELERTINGRTVYYSGHIYGDMLAWVHPAIPENLLVITTPHAEHTYYGNLDNGTISTQKPHHEYRRPR